MFQRSSFLKGSPELSGQSCIYRPSRMAHRKEQIRVLYSHCKWNNKQNKLTIIMEIKTLLITAWLGPAYSNLICMIASYMSDKRRVAASADLSNILEIPILDIFGLYLESMAMSRGIRSPRKALAPFGLKFSCIYAIPSAIPLIILKRPVQLMSLPGLPQKLW